MRIFRTSQLLNWNYLPAFRYLTEQLNNIPSYLILTIWYDNVGQVLTLAMVGEEEVLLRFQHIMDRAEEEEPLVFSLQV